MTFGQCSRLHCFLGCLLLLLLLCRTAVGQYSVSLRQMLVNNGIRVECVVHPVLEKDSQFDVYLHCPNSDKNLACFQSCQAMCPDGSFNCPELPYLKSLPCQQNFNAFSQTKTTAYTLVNDPNYQPLQYFYNLTGFFCEFLGYESNRFYWTTSTPPTTTKAASQSSTQTASPTTRSSPALSSTRSSSSNTVSTRLSSPSKSSSSPEKRGPVPSKFMSTSTLIPQLYEAKFFQRPVLLTEVLVVIILLLVCLIAFIVMIFCIRANLIKHYSNNRHKVLMADMLCMRREIEMNREMRAADNRLFDRDSYHYASFTPMYSAALSRSPGQVSLSSSQIISPQMSVVNHESASSRTRSSYASHRTRSQPVIYMPIEVHNATPPLNNGTMQSNRFSKSQTQLASPMTILPSRMVFLAPQHRNPSHVNHQMMGNASMTTDQSDTFSTGSNYGGPPSLSSMPPGEEFFFSPYYSDMPYERIPMSSLFYGIADTSKNLSRSHSRSLFQQQRVASHEDILEEETES